MKGHLIAPPLAGTVLGSVGRESAIAEWKDAGGLPGPPRWVALFHFHHNDDEAGICLKARCTCELARICLRRMPGSAVLVRNSSPLLQPGPSFRRLPSGDDVEHSSLIREILQTTDYQQTCARFSERRYCEEGGHP
jgi:hypothetical protein